MTLCGYLSTVHCVISCSYNSVWLSVQVTLSFQHDTLIICPRWHCVVICPRWHCVVFCQLCTVWLSVHSALCGNLFKVCCVQNGPDVVFCPCILWLSIQHGAVWLYAQNDPMWLSVHSVLCGYLSKLALCGYLFMVYFVAICPQCIVWLSVRHGTVWLSIQHGMMWLSVQDGTLWLSVHGVLCGYPSIMALCGYLSTVSCVAICPRWHYVVICPQCIV